MTQRGLLGGSQGMWTTDRNDAVKSLVSALLSAAFEAAALYLVAVGAVALASEEEVSLGVAELTPNWALASAAGLTALRAGFALLSTILAARIAERVQVRRSKELIEQYLSTSAGARNGVRPEGVVGAIQVHAVVLAQGCQQYLGMLSAAITMGVLGLAAAAAAPLAVVIVALVGGLVGLATQPYSRLVSRLARRQAHAVDMVSDEGGQALAAADDLVAMGAKGQVSRPVLAGVERLARARADHAVSLRFTPVLFQSLAIVTLALSLVITAAVVGSVGDLVPALVLLLRLVGVGQSFMAQRDQLLAVAEADGALARTLESLPPFTSALSFGAESFSVREISAATPEGTVVLDQVSFEVPVGSRVAVKGPSGAGKSTLLRVIAGLEPANTGMVRHAATDRTDVGYVGQQPVLLRQGADENVVLNRSCLASSSAGVLLEALGLRGLDPANTAKWSGGEQQRLAIARAVAHAPQTLILDEPTSALDQESEAIVVSILSQLPSTTTTIFSTHRPVPLSLATHEFLLDGRGGGRLIAID